MIGRAGEREADIPAILEQALNSDLPGEIMALVRENIGKAAQLTFRMVRQDAKVFDGKSAELDAFKKAIDEQLAKAKAIVAKVQGDGAAAEMIEMLALAQRLRRAPDGRVLEVDDLVARVARARELGAVMNGTALAEIDRSREMMLGSATLDFLKQERA